LRCAHLDLKSAGCRDRFLQQPADGDVFVHGFRLGVFDELRPPSGAREQGHPDLVEVTHNAYGWTGPWVGRRGSDFTVIVSSRLLYESMRRAGANSPTTPGILSGEAKYRRQD